MSNGLTGDFEAAVEVRVEAVNRILASLHQAGASEEASPKVLHAITARVGDVPKQKKFDLVESFLLQILGIGIGDASEIQEEVLTNVQQDLGNVQKTLVRVKNDLLKGVRGNHPSVKALTVNIPELFIVRGTIKAQLSTLSITFPEDTKSEVTVRCEIRAFYIPDLGTADLPAPIHGE